MAIGRSKRPTGTQERAGLENLTMDNTWDEFDDRGAEAHWEANLQGFEAQSEELYDDIMKRNQRSGS